VVGYPEVTKKTKAQKPKPKKPTTKARAGTGEEKIGNLDRNRINQQAGEFFRRAKQSIRAVVFQPE
jgi:hypothetical protein